MFIPFSVNGFSLGSVEMSISDNGQGVVISHLDITLDNTLNDPNVGGPSQLELLMNSLNIKNPISQLDPIEIDLVIQELQKIKLNKV